jgi:thioredoxin
MIEISSKEQFDALSKNNDFLVVDFYADWCGPCRALSPVLEKLSSSNDGYTFCKVNVDLCPDLCSLYSVDKLPTVVVIKNGNVEKTRIGAFNLQEGQKFLDE